MNSAPVAQPSRPLPLPRFAAGAASLLLHGLVLLLLLSVAVTGDRAGRRAPARRQSLVITLAPEQKPAPPEAQPAPPAPEPRPDAQGQPAPRPHRQSAVRPAPAASPQASTKAPQAPTEQEEIDDMVGRIHDNWLEPPGMARAFRCHVRIDYLAGGTITAVTFMQGCGSPLLDDSLKRAIWKTQPLPLSKAQQGAGSVEIEFLP